MTAVLTIAVCAVVGRVSAAGKNVSPRTRAAAKTQFAADVLPVLRKRCFGCHGDGKELESSLDLRTRAGMLKGGDNGPALVPGDPGKSPLFQSVLRTGDLKMPPKERNRLTKTEIDALRRWIAAGAPWPETTAPAAATAGKVAVATSGGLSEAWSNRRYAPEDLWAYRPVKRPVVPKVAKKPPTNPIDAFILARLKPHELGLAPRADKRTLLRRVTFDLTGLPPTPAEMKAFLADDSPQAYRKVVDRLLDSPRYGEQQARHWLDVVRYADTAGFSNDFERPNAWRYRDYVVRSFNADKPFDRFILEQIAGDELDPDDPELLIATGFLRMGPWEHTGMSVAAVTRQQYLDDVTHSVGVTFLAQGLRCAKCHDHKFDPVPTRDYYRIQAVFAPVQFADRDVPYLKSENISSFKKTRPRVQQLLNASRRTLASLKQKHNRAVAAFLKEHGYKRVKDVPEAQRPKRHFGLNALDLSLDKIHRKRVSYFERELKRYIPFAFSVYNGPFTVKRSNQAIHLMPRPELLKQPVQEVSILTGGSIATPGERVSPGVLSAVHQSNDKVRRTKWNTIPHAATGRRLAFARWIASPDNTLTARVIVNRIWQQHFGTGLVATPNNFGKMGAKPTHPELLDWLASEFVQPRTMVPSDTLGRTDSTTTSHAAIGLHSRARGSVLECRGRGSAIECRGRGSVPARRATDEWEQTDSRDAVRLISDRHRKTTPRGRSRLSTQFGVPALRHGPCSKRGMELSTEYVSLVASNTAAEANIAQPSHRRGSWSLKRLHRLIVLSDTYRQSTRHPQSVRLRRIDPRNQLLAAFPPRRLAAEELRDAMLAVTGELNLEMGGPGVYPEINWEVARQPRHIMGSVAPAYQPSQTPAERNRRTIYAFRYRTLADPMLEVFNRPNSEVSCERRDTTTVTPQVFALFNGQFVHDRALALAARIMKSTKAPRRQVETAFRLVYGRAPTPPETAVCKQHVEQMVAHHRRHKPPVVKPPLSIQRQMVEELTGETFTWTEQLDLMKNYQPDLKPWDVDAATRGLAELCLVLLNSNEFVFVR